MVRAKPRAMSATEDIGHEGSGPDALDGTKQEEASFRKMRLETKCASEWRDLPRSSILYLLFPPGDDPVPGTFSVTLSGEPVHQAIPA